MAAAILSRHGAGLAPASAYSGIDVDPAVDHSSDDGTPARRPRRDFQPSRAFANLDLPPVLPDKHHGASDGMRW